MTRFRAVPEESTLEVVMQSNTHPVVASTSGIYGYIETELDEAGMPLATGQHRAQLAVWVEDIRTGNELRDVEMMRRLDPHTHPTIEWQVVRVWLADTARSCVGVLNVTAHGQTQTVAGEFTMTHIDGRLVVEGEHIFDMRDFGLTPPRFFWLWMEPQMIVRLRVVARSVPGPPLEGGTRC